MTDGLTITIATPAQPGSRSGNWVTAERWRAILQSLGHRVEIASAGEAREANPLIAIYAWRIADIVERFKREHPAAPIIVCLSGTDIYAFQHSHPEATLATMESAVTLVGLHDLVGRAIPARFRDKLHIIYQSAPAIPRSRPAADAFDICVIGHLRREKDPFRTAEAARRLPTSSRVRVTHVGRAMDPSWAERANAEMAINPRYRWLGDVARASVAELLGSTRLMVLSSIMEGGANVLGEAIAARVPVIASDIDGSLGLLGVDYPGIYPVGDTRALALMLSKAETEPEFLARLTGLCAARAPLFSAQREYDAWARLIADVSGGGA